MEKPAPTARAVRLSPTEQDQGALQMLQRAARVITGEMRKEIRGGTLVNFTLGYAIQILSGHSMIPGNRGEAPRGMFTDANLARECLMRLVDAKKLSYSRNVEQVTIFVPAQDSAVFSSSQYSSIVRVYDLTKKAKQVILAIVEIERQGRGCARSRELARRVYDYLRSGPCKGKNWPASIQGVHAVLGRLMNHGILLRHTAPDHEGSRFTVSAQAVLKGLQQ